MADERNYIPNMGRMVCEMCRAAAYQNLFGSRLEICVKHLAELRAMGEQYPERIIGFDQLDSNRFFYIVGVKPGPDADTPATPGGDRDVRYAFGLPMTDERLGGTRYKLALLKLRTKIQDQRINAHLLTANEDGF